MPLLTVLLPSATTRSGILVHVYEQALELSGVPKGSQLSKAIMMALNSINRLASTMLLTGGITPVVSAALVGGVGWTRWFILMSVPYFALLIIGAVAIYLLYRKGFDGTLPMIEENDSEPLSGTEKRTALITLGASSLVVYERGYLSALEIFRFGVLMTIVAFIVVLVIALPYWTLVGEPLF